VSYELIVGRKTPGDLLNLTNSVTTASWITQRTGNPGKLTFTYLRTPQSKIEEGDVVRFSADGELQFYGWVFSRGQDRWGPVDVVCYDRLRYLKANNSYTFYAQSAADIIKQICEDLQVDVGTLADTGYKLPSLVMQDKSCIDIINTAIQKTLLNTGTVFVFYDSGDGVALRSAADMKSDYIIGEKSLMTNYSYNTSIDSQTYNSIKLVRPNKETGKSDVLSERIRTPLPAGACCSSIKRWTKRPQTHRSRSRQRSVWSITIAFCSNSNSPRWVSIACGRDSFFWSISMILTATRSASMSCWKRSLIRGKTICTPWNWKQKLCKGGKSFGHRGSTFAAEPGCRRR
jgi:hypothetical protein